MKKTGVYLVLLLLLVALLLTGCAKTANIVLDFSASDVKSVDLFYYEGAPVNAQKKTVTQADDIEAIIKTLTTIEVKEDTLEPVAGSNVLSFRFNLSGGSAFEIIYVNYGVKQSRIMSSYVFDYTTRADVGGLWRNSEYDAVSISDNELPVYEE